MASTEPLSEAAARVSQQAERLFRQHQRARYVRTDRMFAVLMVCQWAGAIAAAIWISPRAWRGSVSTPHIHLYVAVFLGGAIASLPVVLAWTRPGHTLTRHVIAAAQVLFSALLIDLTGGRIETHFHVFVSLAFLAIYKDWRVLILPTLIVAADHLIRGLYFPQSVYGVLYSSPWRWLEHAAWVIFEDVVLTYSCLQSVKTQRQVAMQTTALSQRTHELELSQRSNQAIVDAALDAVVSIDADSRVTGWNPQAEKMFGLMRQEVLGHKLADLVIPPALREQYEHGLTEFRRTGVGRILNSRVEVVARGKQRGEFPVEVAVVPIRNGNETHFSAFIRDITERQSAQRAMLAAKDAAIAADRAKSTFLANVSHEIRTPLNGILGFTRLMQQHGATLSRDEREDYLNTVYLSATNLLALVNDILDLSKIEAGHLEIHCETCSPGQIIAEVASLLRPKAQEKNLRLEARCAGGVSTSIKTDPARLRQLLLNLVGNAIKFTDRGGVEIVGSLSSENGWRQFRVDVIDTGIGIAQESLEEVFDPFVQIDSSHTRHYAGTGLGLTISRRIAESLGGRLSVTSELGKGTTFTAQIDAGPGGNDFAREMLDVEVVRSRPTAAAPGTRRLRGRVLVVDDGDTNRKLVSLVLRRAGAEVFEAEHGAAALDKAAFLSFDLILMDMQMPVMDGYTATRRLRERGLTIPILALTAHAMKGAERECRDAGCTGYLTKPIDTDQLLATVAKLLGGPTTCDPSSADQAERLTCAFPIDDPQMRAIVEEFRDRLADKLLAMRRALDRGDREELAALAHWLKGAGGTVGFGLLSQRAAELESLVKRASHHDVASAVDRLEKLAGTIQLEPAAASPGPL